MLGLRSKPEREEARAATARHEAILKMDAERDEKQRLCKHRAAVAVDNAELGRVAWLCPDCDKQLPPEFDPKAGLTPNGREKVGAFTPVDAGHAQTRIDMNSRVVTCRQCGRKDRADQMHEFTTRHDIQNYCTDCWPGSTRRTKDANGNSDWLLAPNVHCYRCNGSAEDAYNLGYTGKDWVQVNTNWWCPVCYAASYGKQKKLKPAVPDIWADAMKRAKDDAYYQIERAREAQIAALNNTVAPMLISPHGLVEMDPQSPGWTIQRQRELDQQYAERMRSA